MPMRLVARVRSTQASACSALSPLNQFNFVPVWIGDEGNHGGTAFDGARFARDVAASGLDLLACGILDIVQAFEKVNGVKVPYKIEARRPGDIAECWADPAKAKELLGWTAQKNLEDMCRDAWRWQTQNPNGYAD